MSIDISVASVLKACCAKVYDELESLGLKPAAEFRVRDDAHIDELVQAIRSIWVEEYGGSAHEWPWNRGYVLQMYIKYRKTTHDESKRKQWHANSPLFPPDKGFVYFIRNSRGHIKIGWTERDPQGRLSELQTGESENLSLVGWIEAFPRLEKELHFAFASFRIRQNGEWFYPNDGLGRLILQSKGMEE